MMKKILWAGAASLALALPLAAHAGAHPLVAIDAGHTMASQGAQAAIDARSELWFNRDLAWAVGAQLASRGARLAWANEPVRSKEDFASRAGAGLGADLFLSIHHDSAKPALLTKMQGSSPSRWEDKAGRFSGFALFVDPRDAKALECAKRIGAALESIGEHPSLYHASASLGESRELLDPATGVHAFAGLALARLRKSPMVLLEAGVIVNPAESTRLRRPAFIQAMSIAIASGVSACLAVP